jgi:hypothetical protein
LHQQQYSSRIATAAASAFFPSAKTHGNRRVAVLFNLLHFFRIRRCGAWSEEKEPQ